MLVIFLNLFLVLQVWRMTIVQSQINTLEPPFQIDITRDNNSISFRCTAIEYQTKIQDWLLFRNGVSENTTDPCISDEKYSDGILVISSECDGLYSCGHDYTTVSGGTTGLVLTEPIPVYAIPKPKTTKPQTVSAGVGQIFSLPSFFPVSALGNNDVTWFRIQNKNLTLAENGVVTANYSYKLVNVSTSDAGTYVAQVLAPVGSPGLGPSVTLIVTEIPDTCECTITLTPSIVSAPTACTVPWIVAGLCLFLMTMFAIISIALTSVVCHGKLCMKRESTGEADSSDKGSGIINIINTEEVEYMKA